MLSEIITRASPSTPGVRTQLEAELRAWWKEEQEDWDAQITGDVNGHRELTNSRHSSA